ncbi:MAG: peptidase M29 [Alphaproteobacteria bacterium]|nr:peptidase M29 [Alphaproteobacteria bacterium]
MTDSTLTPLFIEEFKWCKVKAGESCVVLTEPGSRRDYAEAAQTALAAMGARVFQVMLPSRPVTDEGGVPSAGRGTATILLDDFPEVTELLKRCNFIVDLSIGALIHAKQRAEIRQSGARTLLIKEPPDALARLIPTEERRQRIDAAVARLKSAKEMHVASKTGTDFRADLVGSTVQGAYGFCDKPGSSATWATCAVLAYPASTRVNGDVVLAPGDIVFPFYRYVESTVALRFKDGFVDRVEGSGLDAELIRDYFARWNERNAYGISHVGWGLHEKALWDALAFYRADEASGVDGRSFEGNFLISTGPNYAANRHSRCHFDIPMRHCSITLDGEAVVVEGKVVGRA